MKPIDTLGIVGLGLMGASLGLAARQRGLARRVVGSARRQATRDEALRRGMVDAACATAAEAVAGADVVVLCLPVLAITEALRECRGALRAGSVVTDVGSTKDQLAREAGALLAGGASEFLGSHPIAGSDQTGLEAARADLYEGAVVVVTPANGRDAPGLERVRALWTGLGCTVVVMTPAAHDQALAATSHLPHLAAAALVQAILGRPGQSLATFCGSGFRDTTRLAAGSEDLWHDIVKTNGNAVRAELAALEAELARLRTLVERGDFAGVRAYLGAARTLRRGMTGSADGQS